MWCLDGKIDKLVEIGGLNKMNRIMVCTMYRYIGNQTDRDG